MKWNGEIVDICGGCRRIVTNSFIAIPTALLELNSNEIYNQQKQQKSWNYSKCEICGVAVE